MYIHYHNLKNMAAGLNEDELSDNPLEFKVALIFAGLFVIFTVVTHYTYMYAGFVGLKVLSFVSGYPIRFELIACQR